MTQKEERKNDLSRLVGKPTMWFPNRSDTNRPVQAQKRARSLKFRIEEELYYLSSKNKGTHQLRGYREADLRLCFRLCRLLVFPCGGSFVLSCLIKLDSCHKSQMSHIMTKPTFCRCENKSAGQLCSICEFQEVMSHKAKTS